MLENHIRLLDKFILPFLGGMNVHEVRRSDLVAWMERLGDLDTNGRPYARFTLLGAWRSLRTMLKDALVLCDLDKDISDSKGRELVFPSTEGGYRFSNVLTKPLSRSAARAGLDKHVTAHTMRRTFNNLARQAAGDIVARAMTGHSTEAMTEHYSHVTLEEKTRAITKVLGFVVGVGPELGPEPQQLIDVTGGRGDTIRTCDFQFPKLALYQAELRPGTNKLSREQSLNKSSTHTTWALPS